MLRYLKHASQSFSKDKSPPCLRVSVFLCFRKSPQKMKNQMTNETRIIESPRKMCYLLPKISLSAKRIRKIITKFPPNIIMATMYTQSVFAKYFTQFTISPNQFSCQSTTKQTQPNRGTSDRTNRTETIFSIRAGRLSRRHNYGICKQNNVPYPIMIVKDCARAVAGRWVCARINFDASIKQQYREPRNPT